MDKKIIITKKMINLQERRNHCVAYEKSDLTKIEFCKAQGLPLGAFQYWYQKFKKQSSPTSAFAQLAEKKPRSAADSDAIRMEVLLPNQMQFSLTMSERRAVDFIQECCHAAATIR